MTVDDKQTALIKQLAVSVPVITLGKHALDAKVFGESMKSFKGAFAPDCASLRKNIGPVRAREPTWASVYASDVLYYSCYPR